MSSSTREGSPALLPPKRLKNIVSHDSANKVSDLGWLRNLEQDSLTNSIHNFIDQFGNAQSALSVIENYIALNIKYVKNEGSLHENEFEDILDALTRSSEELEKELEALDREEVEIKSQRINIPQKNKDVKEVERLARGAFAYISSVRSVFETYKYPDFDEVDADASWQEVLAPFEDYNDDAGDQNLDVAYHLVGGEDVPYEVDEIGFDDIEGELEYGEIFALVTNTWRKNIFDHAMEDGQDEIDADIYLEEDGDSWTLGVQDGGEGFESDEGKPPASVEEAEDDNGFGTYMITYVMDMVGGEVSYLDPELDDVSGHYDQDGGAIAEFELPKTAGQYSTSESS